MREAPGPRPSSRAADRFAMDVRGEVADLRGSLRQALDEAERLEAEGRPDRAAAVLEEQRAVLADLHDRLAHRLAGAAVEREAEHVVDTTPAAAPRPAPGAALVAGEATALRLLASAAAALVGVTLLLSPDLGGQVLRAAGWTVVAPSPTSAADAPPGGPAPGHDTPLAAAPPVPGADEQTGLAPGSGPVAGAVGSDPTVERTDRAR